MNKKKAKMKFDDSSENHCLYPSVQGGGGPWGGEPWAGNQGALLQQQEDLQDGVEVLRGEVEALRGGVEALQGACLVEGVQNGVQDPGARGDVRDRGVVPALGPEQRRRLQRQLAAPSAGVPSSLRT